MPVLAQLSNASTVTADYDEFDDLTRDGPATEVVKDPQLFQDERLRTKVCVRLAKERLRVDSAGLARIFDSTDITAGKVLMSMLKHAPSRSGRRYCACAIIQASRVTTPEYNGLAALARDWVSHVLIPFKSAFKNKQEPLSEFSVASVDDTTVLLDPAIQRDINFRTDVLARDNNECAMIRRFNKPTSVSTEPNTIEDDASGTNALDEDVPGEESSDDDASIDESSSDAGEAPDADSPSYAASAGLKLNLNACHIIKHALAVQKKNSKAIFFTWDILRYYAAISDETLSNLQTVIDSTANGITLEKTMHSEFDDFNVVFVPTNKKHTYQIRWLNEKHFFYTLAGRDTVKFRDHTRQHQRPKPKFLALHRAIAHVLHETKLGKYLEMLMDQFIPEVSTVPAGKFDSRDLALRETILKLAGPQMHQLPEQGLGGHTLLLPQRTGPDTPFF